MQKMIGRLQNVWHMVSGRSQARMDDESSAWAVSLGFHLSVILALGLVSLYRPASETVTLLAPSVPHVEPVIPEQFYFDADVVDDIGANSDLGVDVALAMAPRLDDVVEVLSPPDALAEIGPFEMSDALAVPTGLEYAEDRNIRGAVGVAATGATGAIDRITHEILMSLNDRKTLVVWLFDQSGSLQRQRQEIHDRFDRVYRELGVIEKSGDESFSRHRGVDNEAPLLSAIVSFGQQVQLRTEEPTSDVAKLKETLTAIETDDSGIERVFAAVIASVEEFQNYRRPDPRTREPRRNVMLIVLSDEAGDDVAQADEAVKLCRRNEVPVFVIGVPAPFGRQETYVKYVDPDPQFDQTPQRAIVHQGPETLYPERIRLRFSGSRDFDDVPIDSGFGPYALTRLCYESGGIYFTVHPDRNLQRAVKWGETSESAAYFKYFFDPEVMKRYRPDYVSTEEYQRRIKSSRLRTALVRAAQMSWVASMENPHLRFVKRSDAELAQELTEAQKIAAKVEPPIQMIYQTLQLGESDRQREYSPRWQAGFDLAMGRTLATKVRTEAYNVMLAQAKQGMAFKDGKNNTWVLRPSDDASDAGSLLKNLSDKAREYLNRVIDEHPGTPWSMLAAAELKDPLGWKWAETFTDLDPPAQGGGNNNNNPAPPPRDDQLQMLQRRPTRPIPRL